MPKGSPLAVRVSGLGLACALGTDTAACLAGLKAGVVNTMTLDLEGLQEPLRMPYYRIPDAAEPYDAQRLPTLLPQVAGEALRKGGLGPAEIRGLAVYMGSSSFWVARAERDYLNVLAKDPASAFALPDVSFHQMAVCLRESLGWEGEPIIFNTACTAAANALMMAARALRLGHHKHALVVGVELANRTSLSGFCGLQLVAPELKPFDLERSGIVLGEGIGAVLLTACDGTAPGLYLRAEASNCDIYSVTTANPDGTSIAAVQRLALGQAGIAAAQVAGIKSHGTASPMNDTGEAAGIRQVFEAPPPICALKPFTGHTLGACGVNELALFSLALNAGFFPATRGFKTPDPALGLSPSLEALPASDGHYLLNYFGFGGNNSSLILERRS